MKFKTEIINRVFQYGMDHARMEDAKERLYQEIDALKADNATLTKTVEINLNSMRLLEAENKELISHLASVKTAKEKVAG